MRAIDSASPSAPLRASAQPRLAIVLVLVFACGGGAKPATPPASLPAAGSAELKPEVTTRLELAEITITKDGRTLHVHADGTLEVVEGQDRRSMGTLTADGVFTLPNGQSAELQEDGAFVAHDGTPAPFRLDGETLVRGDTRLTLDANHTIRGSKTDLSSVKITGVTSRGTRRTALLMIGLITLSE